RRTRGARPASGRAASGLRAGAASALPDATPRDRRFLGAGLAFSTVAAASIMGAILVDGREPPAGAPDRVARVEGAPASPSALASVAGPDRGGAPPAGSGFGDGAVAPIPLPRAERVAAMAPSLPAPASPPEVPSDAPSAGAPAPARVVVHYADGALGRAAVLAERLRGRLAGAVELRRVPARVSRANLRFFHSADRPLAERVSSLLAPEAPPGRVRDFTHYRPLPRRGTVEVWLPG
ncbi:MAG: hypothetical protein ACFBWO_09960, partial [Paracoccaceae bacterium]